MIGNTLSEFVDDILTMGGPEKEFLFRGKKYMLQCQRDYEEKSVNMIFYDKNGR